VTEPNQAKERTMRTCTNEIFSPQRSSYAVAEMLMRHSNFTFPYGHKLDVANRRDIGFCRKLTNKDTGASQ